MFLISGLTTKTGSTRVIDIAGPSEEPGVQFDLRSSESLPTGLLCNQYNPETNEHQALQPHSEPKATPRSTQWCEFAQHSVLHTVVPLHE